METPPGKNQLYITLELSRYAQPETRNGAWKIQIPKNGVVFPMRLINEPQANTGLNHPLLLSIHPLIPQSQLHDMLNTNRGRIEKISELRKNGVAQSGMQHIGIPLELHSHERTCSVCSVE